MTDINKKSLILGIIFGFAAWFWAFMIVGSAFWDYQTNKPIENPDMGVYITLLIVNVIISTIIMALYIWKYEQENPIIEDNWSLDAFEIPCEHDAFSRRPFRLLRASSPQKVIRPLTGVRRCFHFRSHHNSKSLHSVHSKTRDRKATKDLSSRKSGA